MSGLSAKQIKLLHKQFPALSESAESKPLATFIEYFYHNNSSAELAKHNIADLFGAARYAYELAKRQHKQAQQRLLSVYNPNLDEHGWFSAHTVIQCLQPNKPFLLDSIINELHRQGVQIHFMAHPMLHWQDGELSTGLDSARAGISLIHIEIDALADSAKCQKLEAAIDDVLQDVDFAVADWQLMLQKLEQFSSGLTADDDRLEFLQWLQNNRFTFLGYRYFTAANKNTYRAEHKQNLGVLRSSDKKVFPLKPEGGWHPLVHSIIRDNPGLLICKGSNKSRVHRQVYPDVVMCKQYSEGREVGVHLWLGLLTSASYQDKLMEVPNLRNKINDLLGKFNFSPESHNGKALLDIFHKIQRDELLQMDTDSLYDYCRTVLEIQERRRLALFVNKDKFQRYITVTIFLPKDKVSTSLREQFSEHLARVYNGKIADFHTVMSSDQLSRIQYIISVDFPDSSAVNEEKLLADLEAIASDWLETLSHALVEKHGEARGLELMRSFGVGFPENYREQYRALVACNDIEHIAKACAQGHTIANIARSFEQDSALHCKLYSPSRSIYLSDIVPILENLGVRVLMERPYKIKVKIDGVKQFWLHDFILQSSDDIDLGNVRELVHEYLHRVFRNELENDRLSQLVLKAAIAADQVELLRMLARLLHLLGGDYSVIFIHQSLVAHPDIARLLLQLFAARLQSDSKREAMSSKIEAQIEQALTKVQSLAEDTVLSRLGAIIKAGVRCHIDSSNNILAYKFAPQELGFGRQPAPWREIFIYALDFEAVHLRFGNVARGGLRWSDRSEDFRTEVLGLVKAQQVKNSVIVPKGAKGGFILKGAAAANASSASELQQVAIAAYKRFMATLLQLTDNRKAGQIERHGQFLRADADDPYLVVAADKGTASFSDHANSVAIEHGFWLADAFASGGSQGYDHKKMGITARGAWEAVKQHFYQLGKDIQSQQFSAIGVGDMGGDVFGNGMLLSPCTQLRAAFNHQHIFIDPDPDCAPSHQERQRLFDAEPGKGGWNNYNQKLISAGGGIYERKAKKVQLSSQAQQMLGISAASCSPDEIIRAILRMPADLLWFGGIGTYIKADSESHAEISDRGNDNIRVDASEVQTKVIGEGANLGLSEKARVQYSLAGGQCNSDFVDNCAGVNCSDNEVNIKILLALVLERGDISLAQRNKLLEQMTDDVAELVLSTSREQALGISASVASQPEQLAAYQRLLNVFERIGFLDRALENLPDDKQLTARERRGLGLARPEICTLQSYAKNFTFDKLIEQQTDLHDLASQWLHAYFPAVLQQRYSELIDKHPLGAEIIATKVSNAVIDICGLDFINEVMLQAGCDLPRVVQAFLVLHPVLELRNIWQQQLELIRSQSQLALENTIKLRNSMRLLCIWLAYNEKELDSKLVDFFQQQAPLAREQLLASDSDWQQLLLQDPVSIIACLKISRLARQYDIASATAAALYQQLEQSLNIDQLIRLATSHQASSRWQQLALRSHQNEVEDLQMRILGKVISAKSELDDWLQQRAATVQASATLLKEINNQPNFEVPMLKVAIDNLKSLI